MNITDFNIDNSQKCHGEQIEVGAKSTSEIGSTTQYRFLFLIESNCDKKAITML